MLDSLTSDYAAIYTIPAIAQGIPNHATSNMPMGLRPGCVAMDFSHMPETTRLVLVPISVQVPPKIAA